MVGYVTFFFDVDNFTDRVMVVLTTMLVIATIQSTIQAVSRYVKVIGGQLQQIAISHIGITENRLLQND